MISENTLSNSPIGSIILDVKEIDSTNDLAHSLAIKGFKEGTVIVSETQIKGRGRRGNQWCSPQGGLYCSFIMRPSIIPKEAWIIERLAGIATWNTIAFITDKTVELKPPNDIHIQGKKVAGILVESRGGEKRVDYLITGIGINCSTPLYLFPSVLRDSSTTLSQEAGHVIDTVYTLEVLLGYMNHWYTVFMAGDIGRICDVWDGLLLEETRCQIYY